MDADLRQETGSPLFLRVREQSSPATIDKDIAARSRHDHR